MGWNPPTWCNKLQAQQGLSCEPKKKKNLLRACVCVRICSKGGILCCKCFTQPGVENCISQLSCIIRSCFPACENTGGSCTLHRLCSLAACWKGLEMPVSPSQGSSLWKLPETDHGYFVFEGFWEQVRKMCHRWPFWDGVD